MRIALTLATAAFLSSVALAQTSPAYAPPPSTGAPYDMRGARGGDPGMANPAGPDKAEHRARRQAKLAAMSPAQREAWKQKRQARRAARQQGAMPRAGA